MNYPEEIISEQADDKSNAGDIDKLFEDVMNNNWSNVVEAYKRSSVARKAKLTKSEDTALHIALSNDKTLFALEMLHAIWEEEEEEEEGALMKMGNAKGNNPLHIAAMFGNMKVCEAIVTKFKGEQLVAPHNKNNDTPIPTKFKKVFASHNNNNETPIFLAALHGKKDVFCYLLRETQASEEHLRRKNGDTALHVAVSGEYFVIAMEIIKKHKTLVDAKNVDGLSPLHVLANKPNAFRSSTRLGMFERLTYYCVDVADAGLNDQSSDKTKNDEYRKHFGGSKGNKSLQNYPRNYKTCLDFVMVLKWSFEVLVMKISELKSESSTDEENQRKSHAGKLGETHGSGERFFPPNYTVMVQFFKFMMKALLIILGMGIWRIKEVKKMKKLHKQGSLLMQKMVNCTQSYKSYGNTGYVPGHRNTDDGFSPSALQELNVMEVLPEDPSKNKGYDQKKIRNGKEQTPMLMAAKTGVTEMVEMILKKFPVAIQDVDAEEKNVVLLAVENRQPHVYKFLLKRDNIPTDTVFRHVDYEGNSALHMAATQCSEYRPWLIPGSALQMQWEIKWFQFVQKSMSSPNFFPRYNKKKETAREVFVATHKDLIKDGSEWLTKTSESCSVVAALVATVAFATSATVPGGLRQDEGTPILDKRPAFHVFAIASLSALCFSVTGLVFFLSILTSRYQEKDFALDLPRKLLLGLTSLFTSIVAMLVSFCGGHIFVLNGEFRLVAYPLYAALCLPITFFAFAQLSLYFDLIFAIFTKVPQRSYDVLAR